MKRRSAKYLLGLLSLSIIVALGLAGLLSSAASNTAHAATGVNVLLSDTFSGASLDQTKWQIANLFSGFSDNTVPVTVSNQQLQIGALYRGAGGSHYNGITSVSNYDLTGGYASVQLIQPAAAATTADTMFTIGIDSNHYYRIYVEAGQLIVQKKASTAKETMLTVAYNPVNHSFLRIRHDAPAGNVVFEASANSGGTPAGWTSLYSEAWNGAIPVSSLLFELKAGTWQSEANAPGLATFSNFLVANGTAPVVTPPPPPPTPPPTPPPAPAYNVVLSDTFAGASIDQSKWQVSNLFSGFSDNTVPVAVSNQHLQIGALFRGTSGSHYNGVTSINVYNLTGGYASVQLIQPAAAATAADTMFTIGIDSNHYYRIYVEAGQLIVQKKTGTAKETMLTVAYNPVNHSFLRIRHDAPAGNVVFEASANSGGTPAGWTPLYSEAWNGAIPVSSLLFELKAGTWQSEANAPGIASFGNFSAAQPAAVVVPPPPPVVLPPQVAITASAITGTAPLGVNFTSNATSSAGIASYFWNFGDQHSSSQVNPADTYLSAGTFTAQLTVTDNVGQTASASVIINVSNPTAPPPPVTTSTITWLTWNVDFFEGTDQVYSADRIATYIAKYSPDVIALCEFEILSGSGSNQALQIVSMLKQKSGISYNWFFVPKFPGCNEGNLLLSRFSILSTDSTYLSVQRSVAEATVNVNGRTVHLFATHLDADSSTTRQQQVSEVQSYMSNFSGNNIISGDFNSSPDVPEQAMMRSFCYDTWMLAMNNGTATAYADNPVAPMTRTRRGQLDHIFYSIGSPNLSLQWESIPDLRDLSHPASELIGTSDDLGVRPSDHNLIVASIKVN